jgi:hypothetical protein
MLQRGNHPFQLPIPSARPSLHIIKRHMWRVVACLQPKKGQGPGGRQPRWLCLLARRLLSAARRHLNIPVPAWHLCLAVKAERDISCHDSRLLCGCLRVSFCLFSWHDPTDTRSSCLAGICVMAGQAAATCMCSASWFWAQARLKKQSISIF